MNGLAEIKTLLTSKSAATVGILTIMQRENQECSKPVKSNNNRPCRLQSGHAGKCRSVLPESAGSDTKAAGTSSTATATNLHEVQLAGQEVAAMSGRWNPQTMKTAVAADIAKWRQAADRLRNGQISVQEAAGVWGEANARTAGMNSATSALKEQLVSESGGTKEEPSVIVGPDGRQWECTRGTSKPTTDDDLIWKNLSRECASLSPEESVDVIHQHRSQAASNLRYGALAEVVGDISDLGNIEWGEPNLMPTDTWDRRSDAREAGSRLLGGKHMGSLSEGVEKLNVANTAYQGMREAEQELKDELVAAHTRSGGGKHMTDTNGGVVGEMRSSMKARGVDYKKVVDKLVNHSGGNSAVFISLLRSCSRDSWKKTDLVNGFSKPKTGPARVRELVDDGEAKAEQKAA